MNTQVRICAMFCVAALGVSMLGGCSSGGDENMDKTITLTEDNVKLVGRTYLEEDTLWLSMSGTGVSFEFTGKELTFTLIGDGAATTADNDANYARFAVCINGERVIDEQLKAAEYTCTAFTSETEQTVQVDFIKLSECANSNIGLRPIQLDGNEAIKPAAKKERKIEFIGDSITCGYGVDDEDRNHHFSTATEDVTKAYAYRTAQALDADYSMFSISGYGIISGYTDSGAPQTKQVIPRYYDDLGFSHQKFSEDAKPSSVDWDYSRFQPDVVVINLGTNDASYCKSAETKAEFTAGYVDFLKTVRAANPDARIICALGIMGDALLPDVQAAVDTYTAETGDSKVSVFGFTPQQEADGIAADWHPSAKTHQKAADALAAEIRSVMGW